MAEDNPEVFEDIHKGLERMAHNISHMFREHTNYKPDIEFVIECGEFLMFKMEEINNLDGVIGEDTDV